MGFLKQHDELTGSEAQAVLTRAAANKSVLPTRTRRVHVGKCAPRKVLWSLQRCCSAQGAGSRGRRLALATISS
jgi:hypothetical protein